MYINKMIFIENNDLTTECYDLLETKGLLHHTDYGTVEILFENDIVEDLKSEEKGLIYECIGLDTFEMLVSGELDFVMVVQYG